MTSENRPVTVRDRTTTVRPPSGRLQARIYRCQIRVISQREPLCIFALRRKPRVPRIYPKLFGAIEQQGILACYCDCSKGAINYDAAWLKRESGRGKDRA